MRAIACLPIAAAVLIGAGCRAEEKPRWPPREEIIEHISRGLDGQAYRITLTGTLELPGWGVIDGATVAVDGLGEFHAGVALVDDGAYTLYSQGDQTFFKREGCSEFARVPGGGPEVFTPLRLAAEIRTATDLRYPVYVEASALKSAAPLRESPPPPPYIRARLAHLDDVRIADADGVRQIQGETFLIDVEWPYEIIPPLFEPIVPALGDRAPGPDVC